MFGECVRMLLLLLLLLAVAAVLLLLLLLLTRGAHRYPDNPILEYARYIRIPAVDPLGKSLLLILVK